MEAPREEEYEEITLADLVRTIWRRKVVLGSVFIVCVLLGVTVTAFTDPEYEAQATIIPLDNPDIIKNWLGSRQAAVLVADSLGDPFLAQVFPTKWSGDDWQGERPSDEEIGRAVAKLATIRSAVDARGQGDRIITITVEFHDPSWARDVANTYVTTLEELRPTFENITRQELFGQYYDGQNEQQAQRRAEVEARNQDYWLVLDNADTPRSPSSPNVTLNVALSVVLGLMLGVFAVFLAEWIVNFRAEAKAVDAPARMEGANPPKRPERPQGSAPVRQRPRP